jgi:hypothetical protein
MGLGPGRTGPLIREWATRRAIRTHIVQCGILRDLVKEDVPTGEVRHRTEESPLLDGLRSCTTLLNYQVRSGLRNRTRLSDNNVLTPASLGQQACQRLQSNPTTS